MQKENGMKNIGIGCLSAVAAALVIIGVVALALLGRGCSVINSVAGEAVAVARDVLGPRALNDKYEWFKNAHASLTAKHASIESKAAQIEAIEHDYEGVDRREWARDDRQSVRQWSQELSGMKLSHNALAAEYNAEMAKFHTAFVNAGKLPAGGNGEIPREVAPYITD